MTPFKDQLLTLRQQIRDNFEDKTVQRVTVPEYMPKAHPFTLSQGAQALVEKLEAAVQVDVHAYKKTPDPGFQIHPDSVSGGGARMEGMGQNGSASGSSSQKAQLVRDMRHVVTPLPEDMAEKQKSTGCFLADVDIRSSFFPKNQKSLFDQHTKEKMGLDNQLLFRLLHAELDAARENHEVYYSSRKVVEQLQRVVSMYTQGNVASTITSLQTLQGEHQNDKLLAFVAAHIFYHRAARGHSQFLPKARQEAKKAAAAHDKINPSILTRFRYYLVTIDAHFDKNRLLDLLKEYGLLTPPQEQHADNPDFAIYLKSMILLSYTDVELWSKAEVQVLNSLAYEVIGGGFIYNAFFFEKLRKKLFNTNEDTSQLFLPLLDMHVQFAGIESGLASFQEACEEMRNAGASENKPAHRWTINQELFKKCLAHMPIPSPEDVLININLNGDMFASTPDLDQTIREQGMMIGPYWPVWVGKLLPQQSIYAPHNLPDQVARAEIALLPLCEEVVQALKEDENKRIDHDKWQYTHPYQTQYSYDRIVSAGMGRTFTNLSFAPKNTVLKSHYEVWGAEVPKGLLFSEISLKKAENAGFAGVKEIQAFFDGVLKVIGDSEYGLAAKQKHAWEEYLKKQNALRNGRAAAGGGNYLQRLIAEIWWFFVFVIPATLTVFLLVSSANGLTGAFKTVTMIVLFLGVLIGVLVALWQASTVKKDVKSPRIHLDDNGNVIAPDDDTT